MINKYLKVFLKNVTILNLVYLVLSLIIYRRLSIALPFIRLELGVLMIALILTIAIMVYKLEKGYPLINVLLAYTLVLPSLFIVRWNFGRVIFRSLTLLYIIFIIIGLIYSIALFVASKRYKKEVDDLNELLKNKEDQNIDSSNEE